MRWDSNSSKTPKGLFGKGGCESSGEAFQTWTAGQNVLVWLVNFDAGWRSNTARGAYLYRKIVIFQCPSLLSRARQIYDTAAISRVCLSRCRTELGTGSARVPKCWILGSFLDAILLIDLRRDMRRQLRQEQLASGAVGYLPSRTLLITEAPFLRRVHWPRSLPPRCSMCPAILRRSRTRTRIVVRLRSKELAVN